MQMCITVLSFLQNVLKFLQNVHTTSSFLKNEHTISFASCGVYQIHQCAYQFINSFKMCMQVLSFLQNVHTSSFIPLKYANSPFINAKYALFTRSFFTLRCAYQFSKMCISVLSLMKNVHTISLILPKCAF